MVDSESYNSVAELDAYHLKMGTAAALWQDLTTTVKEVAARRATQYIDGRFSYQGVPAHETQALAFPRYGLTANNYIVADDIVPTKVKEAHAELALRATTEALLPDGEEGGEVSSESVSIGPISENKTYIGAKSSLKDLPIVRALLKPFITVGGYISRA